MQKVATLAALPRDRGIAVEVNGVRVLLVRDSGGVRAYPAECPHAGAPLEQGAVCDNHIICPWHKARFRISDGALLEPPALEGLTPYDVTVQGEDILVGGKIAPAQETIRRRDGVVFIAGAGAAGTAAAAALRAFGFGGRIVLAGHEPGNPYDRTALSKFVMAGQMKPEDVPPLRVAEFYAAHRIERSESHITLLDALQRRAVTADGQTFRFDAALIATGGAPVRLDLPGADLGGVHVLRSREDASAILSDLRDAKRVVILGGSFIGLEAACGLRAQERDVTVISPEDIPFCRQFGSEIGLSLWELHRANGVRFRVGKAARLIGENEIRAVELEDGDTLAADLVLIGAGVRPSTEFVTGVERAPDGSLRVDAGMRVADNIYAAGDIASFPLPNGARRTRIEHWRVAQQHGRIAACNIAGGDAKYEGVPFFWTYHYGKRYEYLGHAETWDEIVVDGSIKDQEFIAFLCSRGMVAAVVACGRERDTAFLIERLRRPLNAPDALAQIRGRKEAVLF